MVFLTVRGFLATGTYTCFHMHALLRGFWECMHPGMHACGNACTLKCMQPPPPRCKDNGKFTQIPYSAAPPIPSHHVHSTASPVHHRLCALCTPISPLCIHHLAHRWPRINSRRASRKYGWRARAYNYDIVIPTLMPVLRFPTPFMPSLICLQASTPPRLRASCTPPSQSPPPLAVNR